MINQDYIKDIMTTEVITLSTDDTMDKVKSTFQKNKFHNIPIVDANGQLAGIISKGDMYKLLDSATMFETRQALFANKKLFSSRLCEEVMTSKVITIEPYDSIEKATLLLVPNKFHCLPVVLNDKIVGIITANDLLKHYFKAARMHAKLIV